MGMTRKPLNVRRIIRDIMAFERKIFEKIHRAYDSKGAKGLMGVLPKKRVFAFIRAMEENFKPLNVLSNRIESQEPVEFRRKSLDFRLFIYLLQATFRVNPTQVEIILANPLNAELTAFIAEFSPETTISQQEISAMQDFFAPYKEEITAVAWKVKQSYHTIYATMSDTTFMDLIEDTGRRVAYNNVEKLEGVDFTQFYPDQLFPEGTKYPADLLLKSLIYGKLALFSRTLGLVKELNRPWELPTGELDFTVARGLGFYTYHPGKDKIYAFMDHLSEAFLETVMLTFTEILIQTGIVDPRQLMIDSTALYARQDDPDITPEKSKRGDLGRCHKVQILCDLEQTPLLVLRRPGEENDALGFEKCQPKLLQIYALIKQYGLRVDYFLGDAGYFGQEIIDFIQRQLRADFVLDINPRHSPRFAQVKQLFEDYRKLSANLAQKTKFSETDRQRMIRELYQLVKSLKHVLEECELHGTDFEFRVARAILNMGVENYLLIYRIRAVIEGLIGHLKDYYYLAGKTNSKLQIKGGEHVGVHCLLIFLAVQINAMVRYRLLKHNIRVNQNLFGVKLSEFLLHYEIVNE
ncbi:MAG: IS4/IS5 family transposase [Promethearchaeota archaeon]|nr:MAG: IS4/IS5 family transposase [Candidatus Lokiarchaeota archaeon]